MSSASERSPFPRSPSGGTRSLFEGRRAWLRTGVFGAALFTTRGLFAEELTRTPSQTEGPFYPNHLPLDTDNDLLIINDEITPAVGEITHLSGRILNVNGDPIRNAVVEIWQVDGHGIYLHSEGGDREKHDKNFQGFGRFVTSSTGEYYFRTIKPTEYPGRTPHIHFALKMKGHRKFTTQCYIKGNEHNAHDGILNRIRDQAQRESVQVEFAPLPDSKLGELTAKFDIIVDYTPEA